MGEGWVAWVGSAWLRRALVAALVVLYGGWSLYIVARDMPIDFYVYYLSAYGFARGEDVYAQHVTPTDGPWWDTLAAEAGVTAYTYPYRYPPLTAELVWPLTLLPPRTAALIWLAVTSAAFIVAAWLLGRAPPPAGDPRPGSLADSRARISIALGLLLGFVPPLTTLRAGQVNGLLLLALVLAFTAFTRGRQAWAGAWAAVGAMLKLVPLGLLAYLGWRRQWRGVLVGVIVLALLLILAVPLTGGDGLVSYGRHFFQLGVAGNLIPSDANQSLNGFFARLLVARSDRPYLVDAPQLAWGLYLGTVLALGLATAVLCWPRGDVRRLGPLEFALVVTAINLPTPYVWYYQLVLLLVPFYVLVDRALAERPLRWMLAPLAAGYVLTDMHGLIWRRLVDWPLLLSAPLATMLLLWGLLAWLIVREKWGR